ncbi:nucleoside 2-deoxyribosyltransferase [Mucilaginibacter segetis]|uniref:Nucleoside 2-deoxyribosyltransferase n=1 Tax=Mucilaginibacter segetis TaxID=2793071 RepID=A0A934ULP0_9SPHI|nr:nucleoside 2-deoxyribosyltransferase [Mucilaginibacter segetis]MBK0378564.1 nucleoside 2-deoxyribosyltransferase [Mucilaginibacter segetis]
MTKARICLVGDIVVDVTLKTKNNPIKMRLGGIMHAARALWAMDIPFSVAYFAPAYLDGQITDFLNSICCSDIFKLGDVDGAPYVFLVEEAKEIGDQGYEFLLRDAITVTYDESAILQMLKQSFDDYFFISGNYDQTLLINRVSGKVHIDVANNINDLAFFSTIDRPLDTVFVSTSSTIFQTFFKDSYEAFAELFRPFCARMVLKENRGGTRATSFKESQNAHIGAQTRTIAHSIGVGDVFDITYIAKKDILSFHQALVLASWMAGEYAQTTYPDDFKTQADRLLQSNLNELEAMGGVTLPWEQRAKVQIYIAAPDFDFVKREPIEWLCNALTYHHFCPRRPVAEHGQMEVNANKSRKQQLFQKDMQLLDECQLLIAVLLYDDPGTLIEIGLAAAKGIPTIVYDPYNIATNCMLTELPTLVSNDLDEIMAEVFIQSSLIKYE